MSIATPPIHDEMIVWFGTILEPDQVVEVRTVPPGRVILLPADDLKKLASTALRLKGVSGVYFTLNPLASSMLEADPARYATDGDVTRRTTLLIDADPRKPKKDCSSTDGEKAESEAVIGRVREHLRDEGWPEPIVADSGNGWHLLYRIELPSEDQGLVKRCLEALAARFDTDAVAVDTKVSNPSRICKLYGTWARKGESTPERPHRRSRVVELPTSFDVVPGELLEALADSLIVPAPKPVAFPTMTVPKGGLKAYGETRSARYVTVALAGETEKMANAPDGERNNQLFKSTVALAELIGPDLSEETVRHHMMAAAAAVQLEGREVPRTIESGIKKGLSNPRRYPENGQATGSNGAGPRLKTSANGNGNGTGYATVEPGDDEPEDEGQDVLDHWPKPQPLALYGLAGDIVRAVAPHTESDPMAILVQLMVAFANMIGRRAHFSVGATKHFLNLFAALVGPTASGRKGSAWDMVSWVFAQFDQEWATRRVQGGLVSGEGLIFHVRDAAYETRESKGKDGATKREQVMVDGGVEDKRLLVLETEMGRVLKAMSRESNTLSDVLRQAWDRNVLAAMGKNKGCIATGAHISFVGHVTRPDISRHLTREDSSNGFANRFLWLAVRRSKELPDGGDLYSDGFAREWEPIKHRLEQTIASASEVGRMQRDVDAGRMWRGIYGELTGGKPGLLGAVLNRAEAQVMRLACVYALFDQSSYVHPEHLIAALALWRYCEDSARYTFGDAFTSPAAEKLLDALREAPEGLTRTHISNVVFAKNKGKTELDSLLSEMLTDGLIHRTKVKPEKGRPTELWRAGRGGAEHATD